MSASEFECIGGGDKELHVSVTRGPSEPPVVNVYATPKEGGDAEFVLHLDLSHAYELIEKLTMCCEMIEGDMNAVGSGPIQ